MQLQKTIRSIAAFTVLTLVVLACSKPLAAQILYGSLVGNVKDPSDAAVSAAVVTIANLQTNQSRQTTTNALGSYSFPTLQAGRYLLEVTKEGFRKFTQSEVTVTINSVTRSDVLWFP